MANIKKIQLPNGEIYDIYDAGAARTTDLNGLATESYVDTKAAEIVDSALVNNQSDWNQNDNTQPDFIKNRPFYIGTKNMTIQNVSDAAIEGFPVFAIGDTVTVNVDGVEYLLVAYDDEGYATIGDTYSSINNGEGQLGWQFYVYEEKKVGFYATGAHTVSYLVIDYHKIDSRYLPAPFKPIGESYLTFSSPNSFTLAVYDATKHWNGTLEYFASDGTWTTWNGKDVLSAIAYYSGYVLYLRGTGNTVITGNNPTYKWVLTGTDIACIGNIENLLDYTVVESGEHPTMSNYCYYSMFHECASLTQAPSLPATTLAEYCYMYMFYGCTSLTQAPALPATTLANSCYYNMFNRCTSLTKTPSLPATTLANSCYTAMFYECISLTQSPALPATTLANSCYNSMFQGCISLIKAPSLLATTLADSCYSNMFYGCASLKLSSTKTDECTQEYRIPSFGNGTTATSALSNMFVSTGGTFTGTPSINTTYYLSSDNMIVRENDVVTLNGYVGSMINNAVDSISIPEVDETLSSTSTNPVQNKAVKTALDSKLDKSGGTMTGDLTINASKQIIFSKGINGGTSVYEESTSDSNPKLSFYGVNGDERVTLNNIETPVNDYEVANKKYVDDTVASATSSSDELLLDLVDTPFDSHGEDGFYDYVTLDEPLTLETGILYRVTFGGNSYIDTAYTYSDDIYLGNAQIYNDGAVNGAQPYFIHKIATTYVIIVYTGSTGDSDTVTIKIEKLGSNYANVDSIIEQGTSDIWTYRKYASGIAECWGSKNYTGNVSTNWGSMQTMTCTPPAYPITFTEKPVVTKDLTQNTGSSCWITGWSAGSTTSMGTFAIIRPTSATVDVDVNFHVIGKWK